MPLPGPPGAGKSHAAISLAVAPIEAGCTVLYVSAFDLAQELAEAQATGARKELRRNALEARTLTEEGR